MLIAPIFTIIGKVFAAKSGILPVFWGVLGSLFLLAYWIRRKNFHLKYSYRQSLNFMIIYIKLSIKKELNMTLREKYGQWGIILGATEGVGKAFAE